MSNLTESSRKGPYFKHLGAGRLDVNDIHGDKLRVETSAEINGTANVDGVLSVDDTTQASSTTTGSIQTDGGLGVVKNVHVGGTLNVTGEADLSDSIRFKKTVQTLSGTSNLDATDSGKVFLLDAAGGFTVTLPAVATASNGWHCRFIVKTDPTTAYIITEDTASDTNVITSLVGDWQDDAGAGLRNAGHTTVTFVASTALAGDFIEVVGDGTNWYVSGQSFADGGITLA